MCCETVVHLSPFSFNLDSHQSGMVKCNACLLRNMWSHHTCYITVKVKPDLHSSQTWSNRCLQLVRVSVIDRREKESTPSLPPTKNGRKHPYIYIYMYIKPTFAILCLKVRTNQWFDWKLVSFQFLLSQLAHVYELWVPNIFPLEKQMQSDCNAFWVASAPEV